MKGNFFGKTAVHVSGPYSKELSCKKSKKSLEPFLRKTGNQPTNQLMGPAPTKSQVQCQAKMYLRTYLIGKAINQRIRQIGLLSIDGFSNYVE